MGLRSAIQDRKPEGLTTAREQSTESSTHAQRKQSASPILNADRAEEHFGMTIPDRRTLQRLRMHEETYGDRVHEWVDEGMPTDIMGRTRQMEAFRKRQAERPPEVPTNIERQNKRSVQRSEQAASGPTRAGDAGVPEPVREVISSTGRSLDASIQRAMEDRMGDSLGDVRIHTDASAAAACESINARAFTVGNHIAFNQGEYDPDSPEGQHVLAHELAHVRQQTGSAISMLPQEDLELEIDPDPALEREAEETAQRVMQGGELGIQRLGDTEVHIQRMEPGTALGTSLGLLVSQLMVPKMLGEADQLQEITDNWDEIDGHEAAYEGFKAETFGRLGSLPGIKGVRAAKNNAQQQLKDNNFQDRLAEASFPESWKNQLAEMDPPAAWLEEARQVAAEEVGELTGMGNPDYK